MPLITWYMCRRILTIFPAGLLILTAVIWSTQALQRLDLVTAKGQTFAVFFELTFLAVPFLATLIAPIAFVIAVVTVYDAMNRDSELVVVASAGAGRRRLLAPALLAAAVCSALVAAGALYIGPAGLAKARVMLTNVRADVVASIVQPGRFVEIEDGLTVHIRDRRADGSLEGLLLDDRRDPAVAMTYLAETGNVVEASDNTLLVMSNGSAERLETASAELSVVAFDAYAFDLTELTGAAGSPSFRPSERTLAELLTPDPDDTGRAEREAQFRLELFDRLSQPIAPFVYALVVFVFVGDPRMHRQSRFAGILAAAVSVALVRAATYGTLLASENEPALAPLVFVVLVAVAALALAVIVSDRTVRVHDRVASALAHLAARLFRPRRGAAA